MTIQLVGAGLGRTGTMSLKLALERLLGGTCHHMMEVFGHPDEVPVWHAAMRGEPVDYPQLLAGYTAIVDYPGAAVWRELAAAFPDAPVLLSTRSSAEAWWESASNTILVRRPDDVADDPGRLLERFVPVVGELVHGEEDPAVDRLQAVVHVGNGAVADDVLRKKPIYGRGRQRYTGPDHDDEDEDVDPSRSPRPYHNVRSD
jgi:hypothetical protein